VHSRLAITCEGDDIGRCALADHLLESLVQHLIDILASIEASLARVVGIPATLAVYAVETAQLRLDRQ
jgi:hypothetical protein